MSEDENTRVFSKVGITIEWQDSAVKYLASRRTPKVHVVRCLVGMFSPSRHVRISFLTVYNHERPQNGQRCFFNHLIPRPLNLFGGLGKRQRDACD